MQLTAEDLKNNPGRIAIDDSGDEWYYFDGCFYLDMGEGPNEWFFEERFIEWSGLLCWKDDYEEYAKEMMENSRKRATVQDMLDSLNVQTIKVKRLTPSAELPTKAHADDAGFDLYAGFGEPGDEKHIKNGGTLLVETGIAVEIPEGYAGLVVGRSGLGVKGISVGQGVGLIDAGYRGEVLVNLRYLNDGQPGDDWYNVSHGDRIAQLVIIPLPKFEIYEVDELDDSERGSNGHGSSGSK